MTIALVQSKAGFSATFALTITLDDPPTSGNLLVAALQTRHSAQSAPAGFTPVTDYVDVGIPSFRTVRMYYRVVQPGDSAEIEWDGVGSSSIRGIIAEFSGAAGLDTFDTFNITEATFGGVITIETGTVTPTDGAETLLIGMGAINVGDSDPITGYGVDGAAITIDQAKNGEGSPFSAFLYRVVPSASGSYSLTAHETGNSNGRGGILAAFSGAAPPPPPPGIIGGVYDDDLTFLGNLGDVEDWVVRIELKDVGSGQIVINRYSSFATDAVLKRGNWIKITIPAVDPDPIWLWQLETGDTVVADARAEEGGEKITWGGRGGLSYLERSKAYNKSFVVPDGIVPGGVHIGPASTGGKAGQLLRRFFAEAQHANRGVADFGVRLNTLDLATIDFDYTNDSDGNPWEVTPSTADLSFGQVGENGLYSVAKLIATGALDVIVGPDLDFHAYNAYGRDLTGASFGAGVVRFARGENIVERLARQVGFELAPTHTVIQGQNDIYGYAQDATATSRPTVEGFVQTQGTDGAFLEEVGISDMRSRIQRGESISFDVDVGDDELNGKYLPGPPGTNGHFWIGDTITLDTGSGEYGDIDDQAVQIMALVLRVDKANNLRCTVEVMWTRLVGRFVSAGGRGGGPVGGGSTTGGGTTTAPPPAASSVHGHDHGSLSGLADNDHPQYTTDAEVASIVGVHTADGTDAHDASAISFSPVGTIAATDVQAAIAEVASEAGSGMTNPMTTAADLIVGGTAGAPARLAKGADGQVLTVDPTTHLLVWATPSGSGVTLSDATPLVESGAGDAGVGTEASRDDHVHPEDGGGGGGISDPTTTTGDIIYRAAATDFALAGTPSASDTNGAFAAANTNDGNDGTWHIHTSSAAGVWLKNDLGAAQLIDSFRLASSGGVTNRVCANYDVESSPDNSTWTVRHSMTGAGMDSGIVPLTTPATARYWRVIATGTAGSPDPWAQGTFSLFGGGGLTRLPIGTTGQVLTVSAGGIPDWV